MNLPETLESERLYYSRIEEDDLGFFRDYLMDPVLTKYLPKGEPYSEDEISEYISARIEHWRLHRFGIFMLRLKPTSECIGYSGLSYVGDTEFIDIRYGIIQKYWGKGLAKESAGKLLEYGFTKLELETIYGVSVPENLASAEILNKIGMSTCSHVDFYEADVNYYQINKTDYQHK